jgi:hygromycin-B 4-O-kinase
VPNVELNEAAAFLRDHIGPGVTRVVVVGAGEWSRAFAYELDGEAFVIRFGALDEDFRKDALAVRFAGPALPIPEMLAIGETKDGYYAISRRVQGRFLDDLNAGEMRAAMPSLFAAFDAARAADLVGTQGYGLWGVSGNTPHASWREALLAISEDVPGSRTHGWRARLAASATGSGPFNAAWARLEELTRGEHVERSLIHGDLLNRNVLTEGGRISAVLDWGCAMYGDFLYDVAWLCFWQPWYPAWQEIDFAHEAERHYAALRLEIPRFRERLLACQLQIGLDSQAYCAFRERWEMLEEVAQYTLALARGQG